MQYDFVIFLDADWGATTQKNRQHFLIRELARQLGGRARVLAIERPVCPWTDPFRKREKLRSCLRGERGLRQVGPNLHIYTPFVVVHNLIAARLPGATALNRSLLRMLLRRVLEQLGFRLDSLIAWIHHPYQMEDMGLVGEKRLIYDCYDQYTASETNPARRRDLEEREHAILMRADWVFVVSDELLRAKSGTGRSVHLITNAVDFHHFAQAVQEDDESLPQEDAPVLGFTGKITPRLDFALLGRLATGHPDWNLVMIGPHECDAALMHNPEYQAFVAAPNVRLLGARPYQELPMHMRAFDVCLLPYAADDPFNSSSSPLKLYEYLATGKAIVSTDLPAVRPFDGLVRIAQDAEQFERQVSGALAERDGDLRQRRLATARANSWEKRAEQLIAVLDERL